MYQHDPHLDDLLRRPMQMAMNDDEYDEYDDDDEYEDEDDLFGEDVLQAAVDEREDQERAAEAFAASLLGGDESTSEQVSQEAAAPEPPPEQAKLFTRPGIRRNLIGYGLLTILGFVPFVMLLLFGLAAGLSATMIVFSVAMFLGLALSVYNLIYHFQHGYEFTASFNIRTFFRFWPEVLVITVVLVGVSFWNLANLSNGQPLTLSGKPVAAPVASQSFENEEEVVFSSFKLAQANEAKKQMTASTPDELLQMNKEKLDNIAGGVVGAAGSVQGPNYNELVEGGPVSGAAIGIIGAADLPADVRVAPSASERPILASDNALINTFFMGGPLCAALGYAFIIGLAGALFGAVRRFETPFSQKYVEIINIETGEVTSDKQAIAPIMKPINAVSRVLIGLFYGATSGFVLGLLLIVPLVVFFRSALLNPLSAPLLQTLGVSNIPDLAFTNAVTVGGLMVPLVILAVVKLSPQGMSVSEELMRQHYEIKPTGRFVSADSPLGMVSPNAISFGPEGVSLMIPDDELETELANSRLMDELAMGDDNLTSEIIEEFGREFETVFGIDTRELMTQPTQRQGMVDRKLLASALDESFGELGNVPVEISAELGSANLPITEWLNLRVGTLVLLDKPANEEIDILFNGVRKGKGKLVVSDDALAVKVSNTYFQPSNGNGVVI